MKKIQAPEKSAAESDASMAMLVDRLKGATDFVHDLSEDERAVLRGLFPAETVKED